jgi:hypothetical protein
MQVKFAIVDEMGIRDLFSWSEREPDWVSLAVVGIYSCQCLPGMSLDPRPSITGGFVPPIHIAITALPYCFFPLALNTLHLDNTKRPRIRLVRQDSVLHTNLPNSQTETCCMNNSWPLKVFVSFRNSAIEVWRS